MSAPTYNVLFLCTGNSARSILAEAILNALGHGTFHAYSAGSQPKGEIHPLALDQLRKAHLWSEFAVPGAPAMDFVFTVCDNAANEVCPVWPGHPMTAHWGVPDPAAVQGTEDEKQKAFLTAYLQLQRRIELFLALPLGTLDRMSLHQRVVEIGNS
jgi:protein-tyrosine-phosphatase